jgi:hypothetical protein
MVWMLSGSVMSDITRSVPPHKGQTEISISNTRFKRSAQVSGAVTESCSIGEWAGIGVAVCVRFLRAELAGPGTTAFLNGELGAKTPWRSGARLRCLTLPAHWVRSMSNRIGLTP